MSSSRLHRGRHDWHVALSLRQWMGLVYSWQMQDGGGEKLGGGRNGLPWKRLEKTENTQRRAQIVTKASFPRASQTPGTSQDVSQSYRRRSSLSTFSRRLLPRSPSLQRQSSPSPHPLPSTHTQSLCLSLFSHPPAPATWPHLPGFSSVCQHHEEKWKRQGSSSGFLSYETHPLPTIPTPVPTLWRTCLTNSSTNAGRGG